jgi:hypothetical protein
LLLERTIDAAARAPDPLQHYREVMLKNARRKDGSGLGIARIRAEADMRTICTIRGDEVTVQVEADLPARRPSLLNLFA